MNSSLSGEEFLQQLGVSENLRRIIARTAREYELTGDWVSFDTLAYESTELSQSYDVNEVFRLPNVIGGAWTAEKVNLTGLGLILAGTAERTVGRMAQLARICGERKLKFRDDAILSASVLVDEYGFTWEEARRAEHLVQMLPGATSGGQLGPEWSLSIFRTALDYRAVKTVEDLRVILQAQVEDRIRFTQVALSAAPIAVEQPPATELIDGGYHSPTIEQPGAEPEDRNRVFVVYGRDGEATSALWSFLQDLGLKPLDWWELVAETKQGSPFTGEVVDKALSMAQAIVVLMTPDDVVRLHPDLVLKGEAPHELTAGFQARPNVVFEAGMAFGRRPDRTILIEIGNLRPISDLGGRHAVRLGTEATLRDLASRLEVAGCPVDRTNPAWLDVERFSTLSSHSRIIRRRPSSPRFRWWRRP